MHGLAGIPAAAILPLWALNIQLVFYSPVGTLLAVCTIMGIVTRRLAWNMARVLDAGMITLSAAEGITVAYYGHIIYTTFTNIFRGVSTFLIYSGIMLIMRFGTRQAGTRRTWTKRGVIGVLGTFVPCIYQLCFHFSLASAWLSFSRTTVIDTVALTQKTLEDFFASIQIIFSIALLSSKEDWIICHGPAPQPYREPEYQNEGDKVRLSLWFLLLRALSDAIIIGFNLGKPVGLTCSLLARDLAFSAFTIPIAILAIVVSPHRNTTDPLEEQDQRREDEKANKRQRREDAWGEFTDWLERCAAAHLEWLTDWGRRTAPNGCMKGIFDAIE
ncbi:hypothetical protein MKZ38_010512 [Zalerion maritima]|uniref:Uncharacterized protein n=1 Tax=Zalerion maritima TaxID=339359 RepID=A0AAD5RFY2_9PEZI|nr:hypothetical protein MKZ38_010512 [Zalerion maritima]